MNLPNLHTANWNKNLTRGLKQLQANGITISAFADRAKVSRQHIYRNMAGASNAKLSLILAYERAFAYYVAKLNKS